MRDEVRAGEVDLLLALVADRVAGGDEVDLVVLDQQFPVGAEDLLELDLVRLVAELLGDVRGHVDVETGEGAVLLAEPDAGLVELDADRDGLLGVLRAPGGGQGDRDGRGDRTGLGNLHAGLFPREHGSRGSRGNRGQGETGETGGSGELDNSFTSGTRGSAWRVYEEARKAPARCHGI
ncbi:hypothetical protein GCM10020254_13780 [Streptomyces goshikiensis]